MRILFHAPGLVAFRPDIPLKKITGVQDSTTTRIGDLRRSYWITGNRGNLVHAEAPAKIFRKDPSLSCYGNLAVMRENLGARYGRVMEERFDAVVISMANFIRPQNKRGGTAQLCQAIRALPPTVKLFVLGAGLQGSAPLSELEKGTQDLISVFNERAQVFGVRGAQTADWLESNGFRNATVLGCPSLFVHPLSVLQLDYAPARSRAAEARVMTAGHLRVGQLNGTAAHPRAGAFLKAFRGIRASYVFQDELIGYQEIAKQPGFYNEARSEIDAGRMNDHLKGLIGHSPDFPRYYYFNEIGAWRQAAMAHDVFIGDRFHGGVAALQAGVPAIFLTHDNRVAELTEHFALPAMALEKFSRHGLAGTIETLLNDEALNRTKAVYRDRYATFKKTFAAHGLELANDEVF